MPDSLPPATNPTRVLMLLPALDSVGGAELQAWRLACRLDQQGQPVHLVGRGSPQSVTAHLQQFGIEAPPPYTPIWTPFSGRRSLNRFWGYLNQLAYLGLMFVWLFRHRHDYDLVHGHLLGQTGALCGLAAWLWTKPALVKIGSSGPGSDARKAAVGPLRHFNRRLYRNIDLFICLTPDVAAELRRLFGFSEAKFRHIPNGVDADTYRPTAAIPARRKALGLPEDGPIVLYVGRLEPTKRVDLLLYAWQQVLGQHMSVHLLIVGEGQARSHLQDLSRALNIEERVIFYGRSPHVAAVMQAADLFVLPSATEGMPNVLLEALACGRPVIAADLAAYQGFLTHRQNAYLFEDSGSEALAGAIDRLLSDKELAAQLGQAGRTLIEERYALDRIVARYAALYHEAINWR